MEDLFKGNLPEGEHPDLQLYVFPHLRQFLIIDLREGLPNVTLVNTSDVFGEEFFKMVEAEFSSTIREETEFPFAHLINLPLRLEEIIRGVAMTFILEHLGIDPDDEEQLPSAVVFIISGGALAIHSEKLIESVKGFLGTFSEESAVAHWEDVLTRLVAEENAALQKINQQELAEAMRGDSPDYFTLWENRN
jgi:hypothetical protein